MASGSFARPVGHVGRDHGQAVQYAVAIVVLREKEQMLMASGASGPTFARVTGEEYVAGANRRPGHDRAT
jgi:hypothetical protein